MSPGCSSISLDETESFVLLIVQGLLRADQHLKRQELGKKGNRYLSNLLYIYMPESRLCWPYGPEMTQKVDSNLVWYLSQ